MLKLIIIGDEILSGKRQDKHMQKAIALLQTHQTHLDFVHYLPDDLDAIAKFLAQSFHDHQNSDDLIICCGGIGATPDDHTRQAVAKALKQPMALNPAAILCIQERILEMHQEGKAEKDFKHPDNQMRFEMARWVAGAEPIANPYNKIPGFSIQRHYFLPGFPVMAWPMMEQIFADAAAQGIFWQEKSIGFYALEMPESQLSQLLFNLEKKAADLFANDLAQNFLKDIKSVSLPSFGINIKKNNNNEDNSDNNDKINNFLQKPHIEVGLKFSIKKINENINKNINLEIIEGMQKLLSELKADIQNLNYQTVDINLNINSDIKL